MLNALDVEVIRSIVQNELSRAGIEAEEPLDALARDVEVFGAVIFPHTALVLTESEVHSPEALGSQSPSKSVAEFNFEECVRLKNLKMASRCVMIAVPPNSHVAPPEAIHGYFT